MVIAVAIVAFLGFFAAGKAGGESDSPPEQVLNVERVDPEGSQAPVALGRGPRQLVLPPVQETATQPAAPAQATPPAATAPSPTPAPTSPQTPAPRQPAQPPTREPSQPAFEDIR